MEIPCCPVCHDQYMPFVTAFADVGSVQKKATKGQVFRPDAATQPGTSSMAFVQTDEERRSSYTKKAVRIFCIAMRLQGQQ